MGSKEEPKPPAKDGDQRTNLEPKPPAMDGDQRMKKPLFHKSMGTAAGLRKLLPAGTTLAFETMAPSFTKGGQCSHHDVNFVFTWGLIGFLTFICAALSFTDSITGKDGNTYYGWATPRGFLLFNGDLKDLQLSSRELIDLKKRLKWKRRDILHAVLSAGVFAALAFCDAGVQRCLVPWESRHWKDLLTHLPLAVGFFASFVFLIWPSTRNGFGQDGGASNDTEARKEPTTIAARSRIWDRSMATAASLSKLLPTGTTLAFETMAPSFTRGGQCWDHDVHFFFTWWLIGFLTFLCWALRFTDSVTDKDGNTYYGVATRHGLLLFNQDPRDLRLSDNERENRRMWKHVRKTKKMKPKDFLHAFFSAAVFMALAFCNAGVQRCLVPWESGQWKEFLSILPLAVGFLASFVFIIFPSDRNGIGEDGNSSDASDAALVPDRGQSAQSETAGLQARNCETSLQAMDNVTRIAPSTSYELDTVV